MYIIAELGVNHYDIAKKYNISIIDAAKLCMKEAKLAGADAIKFQTYKADKLASKISPYYWDINEEPTKTQYELFLKFDSFTKDDWVKIYNYSKEIGIEFLSTAFDLESVDILSDLQNYWKISSSDITNKLLIDKISKQGGKVLLSTGASSIDDIKEAVKIIEKNNKNIVIMHCILNYPTPNNLANINMITNLKEEFPNYEIGYSDHTKPDENMIITTASYLLGANYIEKHFTLDKNIPGNDHYHSMDPTDLKKLRSNFDLLKVVQGSNKKVCLESERLSQDNARRSIYTKIDLKKGDILSKDNMICKRPERNGISSMLIDKLINKKLITDLKEDTQIKYEHFE